MGRIKDCNQGREGKEGTIDSAETNFGAAGIDVSLMFLAGIDLWS